MGTRVSLDPTTVDTLVGVLCGIAPAAIVAVVTVVVAWGGR